MSVAKGGEMINKVLIRIAVIATAFTINICSAYLYDYEPVLVNSDFRLAAIGNLDLVVIGWDNEINAYDFGESPAGIIGDNNGKSTIYMPEAYGFTAFDEWPYEYEWDSYGLRVLGIAKFKSRFAIGGSFLKARADRTYSTLYDTLPHFYYYDTYNGKAVSAYQATPWFSIGFQGSYKKRGETYDHPYYHYEDYHEIDEYVYKPAFLITLPHQHWQCGFNYLHKKVKTSPTIHHFTLPFIFSSRQLEFGLKTSFGHVPIDDDWKKSIEFKSLYKIPMKMSSVNVGLLFAYTTPQIWEDFTIWSSRGWQRKMGIGIAYNNKKIGVIGMQYSKYSVKNDVFDYSFTNHENNMHLGIELLVLRNLPIRFGYIYTGLEGPYFPGISYDIITAGFGIKVPIMNLEIDFAYNSQLRKSEFYYYEYHPYIDTDHIFGLSGRFIF